MERSWSIKKIRGLLRRVKVATNRIINAIRKVGWRRPVYSLTATNDASVLPKGTEHQWYSPVLLSAESIGMRAMSRESLNTIVNMFGRLESDDYINFLLRYYAEGIRRFGDCWRYADITTVLLAAGQFLQPTRYLEIGVRRGRSMAAVVEACQFADIVGFDLWQKDYAGMENPGPDYVRQELIRMGHKGKLELISGDSRITVKQYFAAHPEVTFDLITVDGDHSWNGAYQDLYNVLPRLRIGGVVVFDDISNPYCAGLKVVWDHMVASDNRFSTWSYAELGYGVAIGLRKW